VQANLLAATTDDAAALNQVYNVAVDDRTSLNRLVRDSARRAAEFRPDLRAARPVYGDFGRRRAPLAGRHRQGRRLLGYVPSHRLEDGIRAAMPWYVSRFAVPEGAG
jgi:UDP-N-acetylglucosamine 4-epimerase